MLGAFFFPVFSLFHFFSVFKARGRPFFFRFLDRFFSVFSLGLEGPWAPLARSGRPGPVDYIFSDLPGPISPNENVWKSLHFDWFALLTSPDRSGAQGWPPWQGRPWTVFFRFPVRFLSVFTPSVFFSFPERKIEKMEKWKMEKNAPSIV